MGSVCQGKLIGHNYAPISAAVRGHCAGRKRRRRFIATPMCDANTTLSQPLSCVPCRPGAELRRCLRAKPTPPSLSVLAWQQSMRSCGPRRLLAPAPGLSAAATMLSSLGRHEDEAAPRCLVFARQRRGFRTRRLHPARLAPAGRDDRGRRPGAW
jgi:hypothetical protein